MGAPLVVTFAALLSSFPAVFSHSDLSPFETLGFAWLLFLGVSLPPLERGPLEGWARFFAVSAVPRAVHGAE